MVMIRGRSELCSNIHAWVYGPVISDVYQRYTRNFVCEPTGTDLSWMFKDDAFWLQILFIDKILDYYCAFDNIELRKKIMADGVWWSAYKTMEHPHLINQEVLMDIYAHNKNPFIPHP